MPDSTPACRPPHPPTRSGLGRISTYLWCLALLATLAACADPGALTGVVTLPDGARLVVGPGSTALTPGLTQQMLAVVTDRGGTPLPVDVRWSSSDPLVADVGAAGLVTANRAGTTTLSAIIGSLSATIRVTVQADPVTSPLLLEHRDVVATVFWVGESADPSNNYISNAQSAFDAAWLVHYGGVDAPGARREYLPAGFTPLENPFYFALPYSDIGDDGLRKRNAALVVPWAASSDAGASGSLVKNRWIRVTSTRTSRSCYAQWEDAGPGLYDDFPYVFGPAAPANPFTLSGLDAASALDVSPAVRDCLGLTDDVMRLTWQFVADADVPPGPWSRIITRSGVTR